MKLVFTIFLFFLATLALPSLARASCPMGSKNFDPMDGAKSTAGNSYTVRVFWGESRNCLGDGTNQGKILLKRGDTSVDPDDGWKFCTNAVQFSDQVKWFDSDFDWHAASQGAGVMGVLIFNYDKPGMVPTQLDDPRVGITMRNRTGGDDMWDMEAASGYFQLKDQSLAGTATEDAARRACIDETNRRAQKP
jgi:hypothetical protein